MSIVVPPHSDSSAYVEASDLVSECCIWASLEYKVDRGHSGFRNHEGYHQRYQRDQVWSATLHIWGQNNKDTPHSAFNFPIHYPPRLAASLTSFPHYPNHVTHLHNATPHRRKTKPLYLVTLVEHEWNYKSNGGKLKCVTDASPRTREFCCWAMSPTRRVRPQHGRLVAYGVQVCAR